MTMKLLVARRTPRGFRFVVHLDTTKFLVDGTTPDPGWLFARNWPAPPRDDAEMAPAYDARLLTWAAGIRADLKVAALAALADLAEANDPGTALPQEGQIF